MRTFLVLALTAMVVAGALTLAPARRAAATAAVPAHPIAVQTQDASPNPQASPASDDDTRVKVMWVAFGLAGGAAIFLSLGYLLRAQLGLVKPPPPQPGHDAHH